MMNNVGDLSNPLSPPSPSHEAPEHSSPRDCGHKRSVSIREDSQEPPTHKAKHGDSSDGMFCQEVLSAAPEGEACPVDVYMAAFLQKGSKGACSRWSTNLNFSQRLTLPKLLNAVQVWTGKEAARIAKTQADCFIGSRFVITQKDDEDGQRVKARLCVQGHLDPDFEAKINSGCCHSPTMSQLARALVLQTSVSKHWIMCLGDIKGASLEAGPIQKKFRPLYMHQPRGGIPGLDPQDVIEITGNIYGSNDAPFNWWSTFDRTAQEVGWERSQFDNCLYFLRDANNTLVGILGAHVDDTITGGQGEVYQQAIEKLKNRFPHRKWRVGSGEFCGIQYDQDPKSFEIKYHQKTYAENLRPISLSRGRMSDKQAPATEKEISALRATNGAANWLASQTRPDLCVQTSFSQQAFPTPTVWDVMQANQLVHRAKQYSHVTITVRDIP